MRILVTGVSGFAGSHLAEYLLSLGHEIFGFTDDPSLDDNLAALGGRVRVIEGDLRSREGVREALIRARPDRVYHLAAVTPGRGGAGDDVFWEVNVGGTAVLLDEASKVDGVRVLVAGSSSEYGILPQELNPVTEDSDLRPVGTYSISKAAQTLLAFSYWAHQGLDVVRTRAFNHTGPREDTGFVCSTFARQLAEAEAGLAEPVIKVGNLNAFRDIADVRDIVRGYEAALERGRAGQVYNICSGQAVQINDVLDKLLSMAKITIRVELDRARLRPADLPYQCGNSSLLKEETGWRPEISLDQTLSDLLDYWRLRLRKDAT
jgi:GDP-4-dehydro-6-deoxy-D-mannose reductase